MKKDNVAIVKKILIGIFFSLLVIIFFYLLFSIRDNDFVKNLKEFVSIDTKILYISDKDNYSDYPINLFKKYEVDYLYIDSTKLSNVEKTKIEKIINSNYFSNIIVVYKNGKIVDAIIEYDDKESLNKFLQQHKLIPQIIGDNSKIIDSVNELLTTEYSLIYLPYKPLDEMESQSKILKKICNDYEINYKRIDAYLLSQSQQNKLNSILQISTVEDQIVILVKDEKVIGSIRGINNKRKYLNQLEDFNFIEEIGYFITHINFDEFKNLLNNDEKNIIVIGKDDCKYCDKVNDTLNNIAINYDIKINYINVGKIDSDIAIKIEEELLNLKYEDGFTTPMTLIVENNKLLNYVVGLSSEEYFVEIFKENGIIK